MKLVKLTGADIDQLRKSLSVAPQKAPVFHHEELPVDDITFGLTRLSESADVRTNAYSIAFTLGDTEYAFIVRPTVHETPSITLNVMRRAGAPPGTVEFSSYTVVNDTVTTLKGEASGIPKAEMKGTAKEATLANFDLTGVLKHLKVQ